MKNYAKSEMTTADNTDPIPHRLLIEAAAISDGMDGFRTDASIRLKTEFAEGLYYAGMGDKKGVDMAIENLLIDTQNGLDAAQIEETWLEQMVALRAARLCGAAADVVWDIYTRTRASAEEQGATS